MKERGSSRSRGASVVSFLLVLLLVSGFVHLIPGEYDPVPGVDAGFTRADAGSWTVLVYMAADNDLEKYSISDINEMEELLLPDDVKIVVQYDRVAGNDDTNGNWNSTRRYLITHDTDDQNIGSTLLEDMGELNMGDPNTLVDFLTWGITNYPAQRYMLLLWDHGDGIFRSTGSRGICKDQTSGDELDLFEIQASLGTVTDSMMDGNPFNIVATDVCLFGYLEVVRALDGLAEYYVSSTDEVPGDGWDYSRALSVLEIKPWVWPPELCVDIVDAYDETYRDYLAPLDFYQLFACDVGLFNSQFIPAFDVFNEVLLNYTFDHRDRLLEIAGSLDGPRYHPAQYHYGDIEQFLLAVKDAADLPGPLRTAAGEASDAFQGVILNVCYGNAHTISYGPGIYFKTSGTLEDAYRDIKCFNIGLWDEFLSELLEPTGLYHELPHNCESEQSHEFRVLNRGGISIRSVTLLYSTSAVSGLANATSLDVPDVGGGVFSTNLTVRGGEFAYYFRIITGNGRIVYLPYSSVPDPLNRFYSFTVGPDVRPPLIEHAPLGEMKVSMRPYDIYCRVTDDVGVDPGSVALHFRRADIPSAESTVSFEPLDQEGSEGIRLTFGTGSSALTLYHARLPPTPLGSIVEYRIVANDTSSNRNSATLPAAGWFRYYINGTNGPVFIDRYHSSLAAYGDLLGKLDELGYQIRNITDRYGTGSLDGCKILMVVEPDLPMETDEAQLLDSKLSSGMELFLIGSGEDQTRLGAANSYLPDFCGLSFAIDTAPTSENMTSDVRDHDILPTTSTVAYGDLTCIPEISEGVSSPLVLDRNVNPLVSWGMSGDGRIIATSDTLFDDSHLGMYDNADLLFDILDNLARNLAPVAVCVAPERIDTGDEFTLDAGDSHDTDGEIVSYQWLYDSIAIGQNRTLTYDFGEAGLYTIYLKVVDNEGSTGVAFVEVFVNSLPVAVISDHTRVAQTYETMSFTSSSTDPDGSILRTEWSLGDGTMQEGRSVSHQYSFPGTYTVILNVTDDLGSFSTESINITVLNRAPVANILSSPAKINGMETSPVNGTIYLTEDDTLTLDASGSIDMDSKASTLFYKWSPGSGIVIQGTARSTISYSYPHAGSYFLELTVIDISGGEDSRNLTVHVSNIAPIAIMEVKVEGTAVRLNATASFDTPSDRRNLSYMWKFSDTENTFTTHRPLQTHDFLYGGSYSITLTVEDDDGVQRSVTRCVNITGPARPAAGSDLMPVIVAISVVLLAGALIGAGIFLVIRHQGQKERDRVIFEVVDEPPRHGRRGRGRRGGAPTSFRARGLGTTRPGRMNSTMSRPGRMNSPASRPGRMNSTMSRPGRGKWSPGTRDGARTTRVTSSSGSTRSVSNPFKH